MLYVVGMILSNSSNDREIFKSLSVFLFLLEFLIDAAFDRRIILEWYNIKLRQFSWRKIRSNKIKKLIFYEI